MQNHPIVSQEEWLTARKALLAQEKELTHLRDRVNAARQALPWVKVEKQYTFDSPDGRQSLAELFAGRSQLIVYHFMLGPGWAAGCPGCSFISDHLDGTLPHLNRPSGTAFAICSLVNTVVRANGWYFVAASPQYDNNLEKNHI